MPYFRVQWADRADVVQLSEPLTTWTDAARHRADLIGNGAVYAQIIDYAPSPDATARRMVDEASDLPAGQFCICHCWQQI